MAIGAVILDISNTLLTTSRNGGVNVVSGIPEMISYLKEKDIIVFYASHNFPQAFR